MFHSYSMFDFVVAGEWRWRFKHNNIIVLDWKICEYEMSFFMSFTCYFCASLVHSSESFHHLFVILLSSVCSLWTLTRFVYDFFLSTLECLRKYEKIFSWKKFFMRQNCNHIESTYKFKLHIETHKVTQDDDKSENWIRYK